MVTLLRIASNTGLVSFLIMSVLSLWRLTVFVGKFARDGHWYRCVHWLRPICGAFPFMRCVGAAAESEDETRPLQPVQIQSLMAQRKLEIHVLLFVAMAIEVPVYLLGPIRALHHHQNGDGEGGGVESYFNNGAADDGLVEDALDDKLLVLYPLHVLSFVLLYAACCLYVNQASKVVYHAGRMRCLHWTLLVASLGFMPLVAGCAGACWGGYRNTGPGSFSRFFHSRWFLALGLYSAGTLLLLAGAYLMVTCMLQRRMWGVLGPGVGSTSSSGSASNSQVADNGRRTRRSRSSRQREGPSDESSGNSGENCGSQASFWAALCRMHVVMLTCTASFVVRAVLLVQLISAVDGKDLTGVSGSDGTPTTTGTDGTTDGAIVDQDEQVSSGPRAWAWLLYEEWVPATLPALCLLYLMRDARNAGPEAMRPSSSFISTSSLAENGDNGNSSNTSGRSNGNHSWASNYGGDVEMASRGTSQQSGSYSGNALSQPPRTGKLPGQYQLIDEATY